MWYVDAAGEEHLKGVPLNDVLLDAIDVGEELLACVARHAGRWLCHRWEVEGRQQCRSTHPRHRRRNLRFCLLECDAERGFGGVALHGNTDDDARLPAQVVD